MAHLLQTGALTRDHIEFYLAYTTQIFEYAAIYDWGLCWTGISHAGSARPLTVSCGATYPPTCTCPWSADPANPISATNPCPRSRHPPNPNSMGLPADTKTTTENVGCLKRIMGIVRLVTGANSSTLWLRGEMMQKTPTSRGPSRKHLVAVWGLGSAVTDRVQWAGTITTEHTCGFSNNK